MDWYFSLLRLVAPYLMQIKIIPKVTVRHDADFVVRGESVSMEVVIENNLKRPIRIRCIRVISPEHFYNDLSWLEGEIESDRVEVVGLNQAPRFNNSVTLQPEDVYIIALEFIPDALHVEVDWRLEGALSWSRFPIAIVRSKKDVLEMAADQYRNAADE